MVIVSTRKGRSGLFYSLNHSSKTFLTIGAATREPSPPASTITLFHFEEGQINGD